MFLANLGNTSNVRDGGRQQQRLRAAPVGGFGFEFYLLIMHALRDSR